MNYFFRDAVDNLVVSWDDLIQDLNHTKTLKKVCQEKGFYDTFKTVITSLLIDKPIVLLDGDISHSEANRIYEDFELDKHHIYNDFRIQINSKKELLDLLRAEKFNWRITLMTSGTTGMPKNITHNFKNITRGVRYKTTFSDSVWGFAFSPTHMAGIQVFFQALLNGSSTVRLFNLPKDYVFNEIANYRITHISATPTFYRLLLPHQNKYESVKRITSGGEKFSEVTIESLKDIFPDAKINNIYALTEAGSLFASNNNVFTLLPEYSSLVKIEGNRLLLNKVLLGDNFSQIDWYDTGDLVEIVSQEPLSFLFTSREKEIINTGGFKVNPTEIEEIILTFPGVSQAHVYPKKSSILGQIVCCNIVVKKETINESELRLFLSNKLQEFKIPRLFNFVEEIKTTRTGKLQRN